MKKALSLILALVMCLSLCACSGGSNDNSNNADAPETTMSKEDMLKSAETVYCDQIRRNTSENKAKATQLYCNKVLEVTGFVVSIEEDHIKLGSDFYAGATVIDVYLPIEDLAMLVTKQLVTIVGKTTDKIETRNQNMAGADWEQEYYTMTQAYLVESTFEATITLTVNEFGSGTIKAEANNCGNFDLTPFAVPDDIKTTDYPRDCVTVLTVKGTIVYGYNNYYIQDYEITNTETN